VTFTEGFPVFVKVRVTAAFGALISGARWRPETKAYHERGVCSLNEGDDTDIHELGEAGIEIKQGDPRIKTGVKVSNMTPSEKAKIMKLRKPKP